MDEKLLTLSEVGKRAGVSHTTVGKWIDGGHLKAVSMPGSNRRRVKEGDLLDFIRKLSQDIETSERSAASSKRKKKL